jgi:hypothetical protein
MKKYFLISFLLLLFISCEKEESLNTEVPEWLQPELEELEKSGKCYDCSVTRITFENEFYYHLYCGYWSCRYCKLYNKNGKLVDWSDTKFSDFLENEKDETVIWYCSD